jgi:hypothetical protein
VRALRDFLLAPPGAASLDTPVGARLVSPVPVGRSAAATPAAVAVLCDAADARAVGVAVAALLARRARAACGLACVWTASPPPAHPDARPPASRAARRLAAALAGRGLTVRACGRAAVIALDADPAAARAGAGRAAAAAGTAPVVLVLGGPRPAAFDALLAEQDAVLVLTRPGADPAIAALAAGGLPEAGPARAVRALALGPAARALSAAGLAIPAPVRRALDAAVEASR